MTDLHVHFRRSDGEIFGWENTDSPLPIAGLETVAVPVPTGLPDAKKQKICTTTLELVDKTDSEKAQALAPTLMDMRQSVAQALAGTDQYTVPDRPMATATREAWAAYRQALRDLSKGDPQPTPEQMLASFPVDPVGHDAAAGLRERGGPS